MTTHASGTFEVRLNPEASDDKSDSAIGRMSIDKQFHGDLEGTSKGQMLAAGTTVEGSAGYVAIEKVSGTLNGRNGSFVLYHDNAWRTIIDCHCSAGFRYRSADGPFGGKMIIKIADGKHF